MTEIDTDGLHCEIYRNESERICYIISPMPLDHKWVDQLSGHCGCTIVVITGMDWDNDLTPWPAPGQPPGCAPFQGKAHEFLKTLSESLIPEIERRIGKTYQKSNRNLVGVSLSGLFALWGWLQSDMFEDMASISGSFWYSGFVDWLRKFPIGNKSGRVYISLGDRETHTPVKAFQSVATDTQEVCRILSDDGIKVTFESTKGTHFAPLSPRLLMAMKFLYQSND